MMRTALLFLQRYYFIMSMRDALFPGERLVIYERSIKGQSACSS